MMFIESVVFLITAVSFIIASFKQPVESYNEIDFSFSEPIMSFDFSNIIKSFKVGKSI